MRTRLSVPAAILAAVVVAAGCSGNAAQRADAPATWAAEQDNVAAAEMVPYDDPSEGTFLRVTLDDGLDDATVESVVHGLKEHFDDEDDPPSIDVDVDGFEASIYPGLVTFADGVSDPDLDRALWLRADGRATAYHDAFHSTVSSEPTVIAPASVVAQLAIDFDAAVTHEHDVRGSMAVQSADGTTGVEWTTAETLGFRLDTDVVGEFARLQQKYPGTTGWLTSDGGPSTAFIDVDPDEVPLADVMSGSLVNASRFKALELGWGPARAEAGRFAEVFGDPAMRRLLDDLRGVAGVAEIGEDGVVVRDGEAFAQVRSYAIAHPDADFHIVLQRAPVLYGYPTDPVFTSDRSDTAVITTAFARIADLPGIARLDLNPASSFGNLVVDDGVTAAELRTAFTAIDALSAPYERTDVFASVPGDYGHDQLVALGSATEDGFAAKGGGQGDQADLAALVSTAWDEVR